MYAYIQADNLKKIQQLIYIMCTSIKVVFVKHMHSKNVWYPYQNIFAVKKSASKSYK